MNYKNDLEIDVYKLEDEWTKQPVLYMEYMERAIEALRIKKDEEDRLDILKAKLDDKIRQQARDNEEKITEKVVESRIIMSDEYQESLKLYRKACYEYDLLHASEKAMQQKKDSLQDLVKLFLAGYFSEPTIDRTKMMSDKINE